jgi:uncharacterized membrane protein YphA (DoxX/SURF4 family)
MYVGASWKAFSGFAMFSTFPDGISGLGLLILRSALGCALVLRAFACLDGRHNLNPLIAVIMLLMVLSALLIIAGYRTRVAVVAATVAIVVGMIACIGGPVLQVLDTRTTEVFAIMIAAALACLGPGAFSLDSRMFGRREIVIPRSPHRN